MLPMKLPGLAPALIAVLAAQTAGCEETRIEHDLLGEKAIPADAYYGVQIARALENFRISGVSINCYAEFIEALALDKIAAAYAHADTGGLSPAKRVAIEKAGRAVIDGGYRD